MIRAYLNLAGNSGEDRTINLWCCHVSDKSAVEQQNLMKLTKVIEKFE